MNAKDSNRRNSKGEGWYVVNKDKTITNKKKYVDGSGKEFLKSFRGRTKTEARHLREKWEQESYVCDHPIVIQTMTVPEYMYNWLDTYKKNSISESSYDAIEDTIENRVKGYDLERYQIGQLTVDIMQRHINQLVAHPYSKATIKRTASVLRNCFDKAVVKRDMQFNPMDGVELPSEKKVLVKTKTIQFYPPDDMAKLCAEAYRRHPKGELVHPNGAIIIFLMYTGLRIGEGQALKWGNVDFDHRKINVEGTMIRVKNREDTDDEHKTLYKITDTKTETSKRSVPLCAPAIEALWQIRVNDGHYLENTDYVLQSSNHNMISERNLRRSLESLENMADTSVKGAGLHSLRHTFASFAIYRGVNIVTLSKLLGHASPSVTSDVYVGVIDNQKVDAVDLLDN